MVLHYVRLCPERDLYFYLKLRERIAISHTGICSNLGYISMVVSSNIQHFDHETYVTLPYLTLSHVRASFSIKLNIKETYYLKRY